MSKHRYTDSDGRLALYFSAGSGGHFTRDPGWGRSTLEPERDYEGFPWNGRLLDTGLLENRKVPDAPDGRVYWTTGRTSATWYAFFWWDRSGDSRPGSNSGFYVRGCSSPTEAFAYACSKWPDVVARQRYPLVLQS